MRIGGKATGGISKHIEDLSSMLLKNNIEPFIWDFKLTHSYSTDAGINVIGISYLNRILNVLYSIIILRILWSRSYKHLSLRNKFIVALQGYQLQRTISSLNIKTVHIHSLNRPVISLIKGLFPKINIVITDHGFWNKIKDKKSTDDKTLKNICLNANIADKIVVISKYAQEKFVDFNLPREKTVLIPNPIMAFNIPMHNNRKKNMIFFNGFNKSLKIKNLKKVIEALKLEPFFNNYTLVAIVNDAGKKYLKQQKLSFKIEVLGAQPWDNIVEIYNKSKILVVPSKSESFGLVYLEALAVGTPIVGFYKTISEFKDVLNLDIGEAYNNEQESAEDLAIKIKTTLLKNYDSKLLRSKVKEKYDWNFQIQKFIDLYKF